MEAFGREATGPGRVYLTGGSTAVLEGWREATVDVDLKLDPEPAGAFEAIAHLKDTLDINVELAAPDQFVPPLPGWQLQISPGSSAQAGSRVLNPHRGQGKNFQLRPTKNPVRNRSGRPPKRFLPPLQPRCQGGGVCLPAES